MPFISLNFKIKEREIATKKVFMTKHGMVGATNLRKPRIFYTTTGCDG